LPYWAGKKLHQDRQHQSGSRNDSRKLDPDINHGQGSEKSKERRFPTEQKVAVVAEAVQAGAMGSRASLGEGGREANSR
jgi:hypothetical protein